MTATRNGDEAGLDDLLFGADPTPHQVHEFERIKHRWPGAVALGITPSLGTLVVSIGVGNKTVAIPRQP